jgi:hypothetical protein
MRVNKQEYRRRTTIICPLQRGYDYVPNTGDRRLANILNPSAARSYAYRSLEPGGAEPLKVKPDGRIFDGNIRVFILEQRGYDVNTLPRVIIP